jgi:hypothetical protein
MVGKSRALGAEQLIPPGYITSDYLYVDVAAQRLSQVSHNVIVGEWLVSTAVNGTGNRDGSGCTPLGVHIVARKIGAHAPLGTVFKDRIDTGTLWQRGDRGENLVLSRILWLLGLQPGLNRGFGIDTFERYIYIHGTTQEHRIGTPLSHGCICMRNADIIDLFDRVTEGTIVIID